MAEYGSERLIALARENAREAKVDAARIYAAARYEAARYYANDGEEGGELTDLAVFHLGSENRAVTEVFAIPYWICG